MSQSVRVAMLCTFIALAASCKKEQVVPVTPAFTYTVINGGNNMLPMDIQFINGTSGATRFLWTFGGGQPATSDKRDPGIIRFSTAGAHRVTLEAWNEDVREKKEISLNLDSVITIAFDTTVMTNSFSPVVVRITNRTQGATTYEWTFEGGTPAGSTLASPPDVTFITPGEHAITLRAGSGTNTAVLTKKITVAPALSAAFAIVPSFDDEDYEAPLTATLNNTSVSGQSWRWSSTGGVISNDTAVQPSIYFAAPGTYTVTLTADNGKGPQTASPTITVKPNSNLRTHQNVRLAISSGHAGAGSYYSTRLRKIFTGTDNLDTAGKWIDVVFFGLNQNFVYNTFISPDSASYYSLPAIPGAQSTVFVNSQKLCGCGPALTTADFDAMTTDAALQSRSITATPGGQHQFSDAAASRIVLFLTADSRKGAIKIRQYISAGADSYIIVDIKVQKNF